jgi:hypothetical protein
MYTGSLLVNIPHRKGNVSEAMFSSRMKKLETELEELTHLARDKKHEGFDFVEALESAANVLTDPQETWKNSPLEIRRKIQEFYFPEGIIFNGDKLRTPKVNSIFKLKELFDSSKFSIVTPRRIELRFNP